MKGGKSSAFGYVYLLLTKQCLTKSFPLPGHGFGILHHTDENYFNEDLGNCMDYTRHPEVNMQPNRSNFEFLARLYGTVNEARRRITSGELSSVDTTGGNEFRGRRNQSATLLGREHPVPKSVVNAFAEVDQLLLSGSSEVAGFEGNGRRRLHSSNHGETYELDGGKGFSIQIRTLKKL